MANHTSIKRIIEDNRIYVILIVVFGIMSLSAPGFLTSVNIMTIFKGMSLYALVAIGFTIVMISGQFDLSVGSVVTLGGMITIGLQQYCGWVRA